MIQLCYMSKRSFFMDYPRLLKEYREKVFLTQEELAQKLGVSYVTLNRWENGKFEPTMRLKRKLHKLFVKEGLVEE